MIGKLEKVPINDVFPTEDGDFTPWLSQKLNEYLGEELGIEMELVQTELGVGDFSCDIVAKNVETEERIVIENQYDVSNHSHLGKLLTYTFGLDAGIGIWIAEDFKDEHKKVLEKLNETLSPNVSLFAFKMECLKIGDSKPAIRFDSVVSPSQFAVEMAKVKASTYLTDKNKNYIDFFTKVSKKWEELTGESLTVNTVYHFHVMRFGYSGFIIKDVRFSGKILSVSIYIQGPDADENMRVINELKDHEDKIKVILPIQWDIDLERKRQRVYVSKELSGDITEIIETDEEAETIDWVIEMMKKFNEVFNPLIEK